MHILLAQGQSFDEIDKPVDLGQSPGDIVVLSFTDNDLAGFASAAKTADEPLPSLRLANLAQLRHPMSADLYIEKVVERARFVLVRLLGGLDYWRYGVEQIYAAAKKQGIGLAVIPGDGRPDPRLASVSTVDANSLDLFSRYCSEGGTTNLQNALKLAANLSGKGYDIQAPQVLPMFGAYEPVKGIVSIAAARASLAGGRPGAIIVFYRALLLAEDMKAIDALHAALVERGFAPSALFVTSLKDQHAAQFMRQCLSSLAPAVILNTTAFSARTSADEPSPLEYAGVPILQTVLAGSRLEAWRDNQRGLSAADLAMNVVLPEIDGRLFAGAISFKRESASHSDFEFTPLLHAPDDAGLAHAVDMAAAWARLARTPRAKRRLAFILPDYPGKAGRAGSGVGLDGPGSAAAILSLLKDSGYALDEIPQADEIFRRLTQGAASPILDITQYRRLFANLPRETREKVLAAWGEPESDFDCDGNVFHHRVMDLGHILLAVQPDRAARRDRKDRYHDPALPPRHGYIAFHLWLRHVRAIHAFVILGAHGTLEWLPGKAVALSQSCFPRTLVGAVPVLYPFIVSNPGEAAQAKRRIGAVTIGHMVPPLIAAGLSGATTEIEPLIDEFAQAQTLDRRRADRLADEILSRAQASGLAQDCGIDPDLERPAAIAKLDAWLCELKEMRIRDGRHIYGAAVAVNSDDGIAPGLREVCAAAEREAILDGLDGAFVAPGPGGAPSRGRRDVLPTGRNLFAIDPRAVPTRMAMDLGARAAAEFVRRHLQDHGEYPRQVVMDLWASTAMRTGGEDLAQALALLGVRPTWDHSSTRVSGFEIVPLAKMEWPRIDVTLRISGLFRDVFPDQIALFDAAVRAVAKREEPDDANPLAAAARESGVEVVRIFGPAPGAYGTGIERVVTEGGWDTRNQLADSYIAASGFAYGVRQEGKGAEVQLRDRLASTDVVVQVSDVADGDVLDTDTSALHLGGLAAAIEQLSGKAPALYQSDTGNPDRPIVRSYVEAVARAVRGRAANPRWIAGQMRHGASGAAAMADAVDGLFAFAATAGADCDVQFAQLFDAYLADNAIAESLRAANPAALGAIVARFNEAIRRGLWKPRRNSVLPLLLQFGEARR